jgi:hypothetical protein
LSERTFLLLIWIFELLEPKKKKYLFAIQIILFGTLSKRNSQIESCLFIFGVSVDDPPELPNFVAAST